MVWRTTLICSGDSLLHGAADGGCVLFHGGDDDNAHLHCSDHILPFFWKMHVAAPGLESVSFAALGLESVSLEALGLESVSLAALGLESISLAILILLFQVRYGGGLIAGHHETGAAGLPSAKNYTNNHLLKFRIKTTSIFKFFKP